MVAFGLVCRRNEEDEQGMPINENRMCEFWPDFISKNFHNLTSFPAFYNFRNGGLTCNQVKKIIVNINHSFIKVRNNFPQFYDNYTKQISHTVFLKCLLLFKSNDIFL